jgi:DNA-binding NarL/FixJ family response regulator
LVVSLAIEVEEMPMHRMVIADDHALLRSGLVRLFKGELEIVAETCDGESTMTVVDAVRPDLLLLDLWMPRCKPTELVSRLARAHPALRIIVLTGIADHSGLHGLLGLGVSAIVLKGSGVSRLREAIARAIEHRVYIDPDLRIAAPAAPLPLTPRESEVMALLAHGNSYRDIGSQLHLGERTIETYRRRIADKLGVRSRAELVAYAHRHKLVHALADAPDH